MRSGGADDEEHGPESASLERDEAAPSDEADAPPAASDPPAGNDNAGEPEDPPVDPTKPRMTLDAKRVFLTSTRTMKAIRRVARSRGVPPQDRETVVQETITLAWTANLPEDESEARKVVNKIAFRVSCKMMGEDPKGVPEEFDEDDIDDDDEGRAPGAHAPHDPVLHDDVERLIEKARKNFPPARVDGFLESAAKGTPATVEAARRGVSEAHVRKERSEIRLFLKKHATKMGLAVAGVLALLIADPTGWTRVPFMPGKSHTSDLVTIHRDAAPVANDPASLRARAAKLCANADWDACLIDLDAAKTLDPEHQETPDEERMRNDANAQIYVGEGQPGPIDMSKDGLH